MGKSSTKNTVRSGKKEAGTSTSKAAMRAANDDAKLDNIERQSLLYDFYGALLTEGQNEVMALYHEDNLSLSEIAEQLGTTRQAVHYTLKKAEAALGEYEEKLCLIEQYQYRARAAERLAELILNAEMSFADKAEAAILLKAIEE